MTHPIFGLNDLTTSAVVFTLDRNQVIDYGVAIKTTRGEVTEFGEGVFLVQVWITLNDLHHLVCNDREHSTVGQEFNVAGLYPYLVTQDRLTAEILSTHQLKKAVIQDV